MDAELATTPHGLWEAGADAVASHVPAARDRVREALLTAVVAEVADVGWDRATVAGICRRAGVQVADFDAQFGDKHDCFATAGRIFVDELLASIRAALRGVEEWEAGVRAALGALLTYLAHHPQEARAFLVEALMAGPEALANRDIALRSFASFLAARQLALRDPAGGPSALVSEATVGGIYGIVARRVRDGQIDSLPELRSALAYFLLAPLVGCPRARLELV